MRRSDVQRSARRWLALALDDDAWTLEDERVEVADDQRPVGVVETTTGLRVAFARTSVPQGDVQKGATLTMTLYPLAAGTAQECGARARELVETITDAWTVGLIVPPDAAVPGSVEVPLFPAGLPLWDFEGVEDGVATVSGPPVAYALADSVIVREVADPLDDRRWTVVAELRVTWWSGGRSRWGSEAPPLVARVPLDGPHVAP